MDIPWLQQQHLQCRKTSSTDIHKRYELLHELLYFIFDSLLIPLIRSNFYVTESNVDRNLVFYFRHDVWNRIAEPVMTSCKETMFQEVQLADARRVLESRSLSYCQVRFLPKGLDLRPIMNLRRRSAVNRGSKTLAPSINTVLRPIHNFLQLERVRIQAVLDLCAQLTFIDAKSYQARVDHILRQ